MPRWGMMKSKGTPKPRGQSNLYGRIRKPRIPTINDEGYYGDYLRQKHNDAKDRQNDR